MDNDVSYNKRLSIKFINKLFKIIKDDPEFEISRSRYIIIDPKTELIDKKYLFSPKSKYTPLLTEVLTYVIEKPTQLYKSIEDIIDDLFATYEKSPSNLKLFPEENENENKNIFSNKNDFSDEDENGFSNEDENGFSDEDEFLDEKLSPPGYPGHYLTEKMIMSIMD